jgi:polyhydroxyalkanoate synthesis regulator phasin
MKKSLFIAGASLLALGMPTVSHAQGGATSGPFADVPADHWAYSAVDSLQKAGIVIGYPDGTYGGRRAMTRYEFAVAIARLLPLLNNKVDTSNLATKDDLAALRSDLEGKLAANQGAIDDLRKLVDEFKTELQKLGQDVAAVNARLDALEQRVAAIEEEQRRVKFSGALNLIAKGESTTKGADFIDKNGGAPVLGTKRVLQTADVYHDFVLGIRGKVSDTATANVKLDFGNYLSAIGNTATAGFGYADTAGHALGPVGALNAGDQQVTVWEAYLDAPVNLGLVSGANLQVGRFPNQWTKYTLKQVDADVYTSLYQTDSGNIETDGGKLTFKLGPANLQAWAGQFKATPYSQPYGGSIAIDSAPQVRPAGLLAENHATTLTQGAGVRATFGSAESAQLGLTVEQFGIGAQNLADPNSGKNFNRLSVYGVDFDGSVPILSSLGVTLQASWTESAQGLNSGFNNSGGTGKAAWRYQALDAQLGYKAGAFSVKGGYQYVGPDFSAPGYWGKVGAWSNPTNVEGGVASAKYAFTPNFSLNADFQSYKAAYGSNANGTTLNSPLQQGDKLSRYQVGLNYGLSSSYAADLGYEEVDWDLKNQNGTLNNAGKPKESYVTIGLGHTLNKNTSFKLLYQIVKYKDKGTGFSGLGDTDGNVAVGQFQIKF